MQSKRQENIKYYTLKNARYGKVKENLTKYEKTQITNSKQAFEIIKSFYGDEIGLYEECWAMYLNAANYPIGFAKISQGAINNTIVDNKLVLKYAIDVLASGIILAHNHPSGNPTPGTQDIGVTEKLKKACELFDIRLLDHIIVTENKYFSFEDTR